MDNKKKIRDRKLKKEKGFYEEAEKRGRLDEALDYKPSEGRGPASESEDEDTEVRKRVLGKIAKGDAKGYFQNKKIMGDEKATDVMSRKSDDYTKKQIKDYTKEELFKKRMEKKS